MGRKLLAEKTHSHHQDLSAFSSNHGEIGDEEDEGSQSTGIEALRPGLLARWQRSKGFKAFYDGLFGFLHFSLFYI